MSITLEDVAVLLDIPIDGHPLTLLEPADCAEMCERLLGLSPPGDAWWGSEIITMKQFRAQLATDIPQDASQVQVEQRAHAIIIHIITSRLICDHSKSRVCLKWLHYLEDSNVCQQHAWGSAVLGYTNAELSRLTLGRGDSIGGCLTLVQTWSWSYLPVGRITMKRLQIDVSLPFASRWVGPKSSLSTSIHMLSSIVTSSMYSITMLFHGPPTPRHFLVYLHYALLLSSFGQHACRLFVFGVSLLTY